jgi:uncharacterized protein (DUF2267 family)
MTVPQQYTDAQRAFTAFLGDAMRELDAITTHQAYHTVAGVFRAFRRRVDPQDALRFADVLPAIGRAIFVSEWDLSEPRQAFGSREDMLADVRAFQRYHNLAPDNAIEAVARAVVLHVDSRDYDRMMSILPAAARAFWATEPEAGS